MDHILFEYRGTKHFIARIDNQIIDDFNIETRASNVYIRETMFTKDAFINDISHLTRT
jgi:hypothetical protein